MTTERGPRRQMFLALLAVALLLAAICYLLAAPPLAPQREETSLNDVPVVIEYATSASAQQLMLPYYPGAERKESFAYAVTTKDGDPVCYYGRAVLVTPDPPDKVAAAYRKQLPGGPEPEIVQGSSGERRVLAVGTDEEVRQVTITAAEAGSRIELIRATRPAPPAKPVRPRGRQEKVI